MVDSDGVRPVLDWVKMNCTGLDCGLMRPEQGAMGFKLVIDPRSRSRPRPGDTSSTAALGRRRPVLTDTADRLTDRRVVNVVTHRGRALYIAPSRRLWCMQPANCWSVCLVYRHWRRWDEGVYYPVLIGVLIWNAMHG